MRHQKKHLQLNRTPTHRRALLRNLAESVLLYGKIKTTEPKARALQPFVEHLITVAKTHDKVGALRLLKQEIGREEAIRKILEELLKKYERRTSGFTRITALGYRTGDAAPVVQIELL